MTGGKKFDQGKPMLSLIPPETLLGVMQVFTDGVEKYGKHNFRAGLEHTRPLDAAIRHILAILNNEEMDPESKRPHVYHGIASLIIYDWQRLHHPKLDDRYKIHCNLASGVDKHILENPINGVFFPPMNYPPNMVYNGK